MAESLDKPLVTEESGLPSTAAWWTPVVLVQGLILAAVLAVYYEPVLRRLIHIWSNSGDWSHGFIVPLFGIYYLYLQRHRMPVTIRDHGVGSRLAGAGLLLLALALYVASIHVKMEYPKTISLVMSVMGIVLMVGGWPVARWSWFAVAFLVFAMPLPVRVYTQLTMPLREVASMVSAAVLSLVPGMEAEARGTLVEYVYGGNYGTLDIERACSGMRLMMTMTALGVAMAFVHERPIWQRMVMILACVPIAIFCNFIRVTTTGFLVVYGRPELARGMWHTLLGLGMLAIAFSLYWLISHVLSNLYEETEPADVEQTAGAGGVTE